MFLILCDSLHIHFKKTFFKSNIEDAIREIYKYKRTEELHSRKNASEWAAKEFRAQRNIFLIEIEIDLRSIVFIFYFLLAIGNLYITGISLFLCFVIKRLVVLISNAADLAMEKKVIEIEKNTILNDFLILTEKFKPNENVGENVSSLILEQSSGNMNIEREETRSRSLSRTNISIKKDE